MTATKKELNNKKTYLLFMYKESEHWCDDHERSQYITMFTDDVDEMTKQLYSYGWQHGYGSWNSEWDITTVVKGVVVSKNSFIGNMKQYDREAEERKKAYEVKLEEQRKIEAEEWERRREEHDKREWDR